MGVLDSYWLIEHASRGVYMEWHYTAVSGLWRPRFSWSVLRTEGHRFFSEAQAKTELAKVLPYAKGAYIVAMSRAGDKRA